MTHLRKLCGIFALWAVVPATIALADGAAPAATPAPAAGEAAAASRPPLFTVGKGGILGSASDSPNVLAGVVAADHLFVAAGLSLTINGNGLSPTDTSDKVAFNALIGAEYALIDRAPFAMGPEVLVVGVLTPGNALNTVIVQPGWFAWYAPFPAPVLIGTSIELPITIPTGGGQPSVSLATAGVRIGYIFN